MNICSYIIRMITEKVLVGKGRAKLPDRSMALQAIRITFEMLAQRLTLAQIETISSELAPSVAVYLHNGQAANAQSTSAADQWQHIAEREEMEPKEIARQAGEVLEVLSESSEAAVDIPAITALRASFRAIA